MNAARWRTLQGDRQDETTPLRSTHLGPECVAGGWFGVHSIRRRVWSSLIVVGLALGGVAWPGDAAHALAPPIVSEVAPATGLTSGGTSVIITGSQFSGATTVNFGSTVVANLQVNNNGTSIAVTSPPGAAGTVDVTVSIPGATSSTNAADHFTYTVQASPNVVACDPGCTNTVSTPLNETSVSVTGSSGTTSAASTSLVINTGTLSCGSSADYPTAVSTLSASGFASTAVLTVTEVVGGQPTAKGVRVCFEKSGSTEASFLPRCHTGSMKEAACIQSAVEQPGGGVVTTFLVPATDPRFWTGYAGTVQVKSFSPRSGGPGVSVTIKGKGLTQVEAAVIGGATATIQSATSRKLVLIVPTTAVTGTISLTAASGTVTSAKSFTVN
jgi:hypothetical protein